MAPSSIILRKSYLEPDIKISLTLLYLSSLLMFQGHPDLLIGFLFDISFGLCLERNFDVEEHAFMLPL